MKKSALFLILTALLINYGCNKSNNTNCRLDHIQFDSSNAILRFDYTNNRISSIHHTTTGFVQKLEYIGDSIIKFYPGENPDDNDICKLNSDGLTEYIEFNRPNSFFPNDTLSSINDTLRLHNLSTPKKSKMIFFYNVRKELDSMLTTYQANNGQIRPSTLYKFQYDNKGNIIQTTRRGFYYSNGSFNNSWNFSDTINLTYDNDSNLFTKLDPLTFIHERTFLNHTSIFLAQFFSRNNILTIKNTRPIQTVTVRNVTDNNGRLIYNSGLEWAHYFYTCN